MNKLLLAVLLLGLSLSANAQQTLGKSIPEYTTKLGTTIHVGDTLRFGRGQREDGGFKYAIIPPNILTAEGSPLPVSWSNKKAVVKDIKDLTSKKGLNRIILVVFKAGVYNARLDADAAEDSGELVTKFNQKKATPTSGGVADELIKLKSLLDAGTITQAEFDAQKAKLLNP
jgi:hypothetical protein